MLSRKLFSWVGFLAICASSLAIPVSAQNHAPYKNIFFGFDFVLTPLAIKWACGGPRETDLAQIRALIIAFPEDAESAEMEPLVESFSTGKDGLDGLHDLVARELTDQQSKRLCEADLPLTIDWLTPQQLVTDDESGTPEDQKTKWASFYAAVDEQK